MLTQDQIEDIQKDGFDWFGKPLRVDGDYGPKTQWWHYITTLHPVRQLTVREHLRYYVAGTKETSPNEGPVVSLFNAPAGEHFVGKAWCIGYQSFVLRASGADWPIHHVSTYEMLEWAKDTGRITKNPRPGDVHAFMYPKGSKLFGSGHGGGLLFADPLWVACCDGNVGDSVQVGKRARDGLTFIKTVLDDVESPLVPMSLTRLDGWKDR